MAAKKRITVAIIPSAGMGRRMGSKKKNYIEVLGRPVLAHTLAAFEKCAGVTGVILVVPPGDEDYCRRNIVSKYRFKKVLKIVAGGKERQDSVGSGLAAIDSGLDPRFRHAGTGIIIVHDGARPLVTPGLIADVIKAAEKHGAALAAVPVKDTIKEARKTGGSAFVKKTVPREDIEEGITLWAAQTPQAFKADILAKAHKKAAKDRFIGTDESVLVERLGKKCAVVAGLYENIKITTPEDLTVAEGLLERRRRGRGN